MNHNRKSYNEALTAGVKQIGREITPQELQQRGVRRVRSIGMSQLSKLVEMAVNQTLMERTIGTVKRGDLSEVVDRAKGKMLNLLRGQQDLENSQLELSQHRRELQVELRHLREVRPSPDTIHACHDERLFAQALRERVADLSVDPEALIGRALAALAEARVGGEGTDSDRVDQLERRVSKLVQSLEHAERALAEMSKLKNVDLGIASLYRVVQGLSDLDPAAEMKQEMMKNIFEANMELRDTLLTA